MKTILFLPLIFLICFLPLQAQKKHLKEWHKITMKNLPIDSINIQNEKYFKKFDYILETTKSMLQKDYYQLKPIGDSFSKIIFYEFLKQIDHDKLIFFQSDINFLKKYETKLDEQWQDNQYTFLINVDSLYNIRVKENKEIAFKLLNNPFQFLSQDSFNIDRDSVNFIYDIGLSKQKRHEEKSKQWQSFLKYLMIDRYENEVSLKAKNVYIDSLGITKSRDTSYIIKADTIIEQDARKKITKIITKMFERYSKRFNIEEKFNIYLNVFLETLDPHTNFLPPADRKSFDESMKKKFYGIGAQLKDLEIGIKIEKVLLGGAAFKSKKIFSGDIILKVGQGNDSLVDIIGYDIQDAIRLIKGNNNTIVSLEIRHLTGELEIIKLVREEVKFDESLVKSAIIEDKGYKIGFLYVPDFYTDFGDDENGSHSYIDAATEIEKLKKENIDGIVIDLRNNGGGSLYDVVQMAGFFISSGAIVQVKTKQNNINILDDKFKWILYPGPITVMVNEYSASASEIFAAAIQDYKRGIIIGNPTYGKGTVQTTKPLGVPLNWKDTMTKDIGTIKLTIQKFYRINGNSTQNLGVIPDIIFPSRLEYAKNREKDNPNAMPYDAISACSFKEWMYSNFDKNKLLKNSNERILENPYFKAIKDNSKWLSTIQDGYITLNMENFIIRENKIKEKIKEIDSIVVKFKDTILVNLMEVDKKKFKDGDKNLRNKEWAHSLRKDIQLIESVNVLKEMIGKKTITQEDAIKMAVKKNP